MQRGGTCGQWRGAEGRVVGNVLDSRHDVGNGVDREHVGIVVDGVDKMSARDVPTLDTNKDNKSTKPTTRTLQQPQAEHELTTAMTMAIKNGPSNTAMPGPSLQHWPTMIRQDNML